MRWKPAPFVVGAYADDSKDYSAQDCVNYIPEKGAEGSRSPALLRQAPGLYSCGTIGTGPHRAGRDCEGALLIVSGTSLYHVRADRSATNVGTIPGVTRCKIAHNAVDEALIVNGTDAYLYNWQTAVFAKVTDTSFLGGADVDYLGHYFTTLMASRIGWQHSDLEDGADWNGLDRYDAEAAPDKLRALIADHGQLLVFGERTGEWFANEPLSATEAFQNTRSVIPRGCAATHSVCRLDNTVFWLGDDGMVYRLSGQTQPQRISTPAIEQAISRCTLDTAFAFIYEDRGHAIYYLTFQNGQTWGYDVASGLWHRRQSYGLDRWKLDTLFKWDGRWYGGDYNAGTIYTLDWNYAYEGGTQFVRSVRPPVWHDHGHRKSVAGVQLHVSVRESAAPTLPSGQALVALWDAIIVTNPLPDPYVGQVVSHQYAQTGGIAPITWTTSGTLPTGLTMNASGLVTGTVTAAGTFTWTVIATDVNLHVGTLAETTTTLPVSLMVGIKRYAGAPSALYALADNPFTVQADITIKGDYSAVSENGLTMACEKVEDAVNQYFMFRWNTTTRVYDEATITNYQAITSANSTALSVTPDGKWVLAVNRDNGADVIVYAYKWSGTAFVYTNSITITTTGTVDCLAMAPSGDKFALGYSLPSGLLRTYSLNTDTGAMAQIATATLGFGLSRLDWRGDYIAGGRISGNGVYVYNATTLAQVATVAAAHGHAVMFSPNADYLYCGDATNAYSYSFSGTALTLGNTAAFGFTCHHMFGNAARTHVIVTPDTGSVNNKIYAVSGLVFTTLTSVAAVNREALWTNLT